MRRKKNSTYLYSSFERTFGKPVGNKVRIKNLNSGKYLCPHHGCCDPSRELVQYGFNNADDKIFKLVSSGVDDSYFILSDHNNLALDVKGASDKNGTPMVLWHAHFGDNQRFKLIKQKVRNQDCVRIVSWKTKKGLDIKDHSKTDGSKAHFWKQSGKSYSQKWVFETVE
ncbi:MAG: RICIN domain-containing protein [Oligoflexales bacterium]